MIQIRSVCLVGALAISAFVASAQHAARDLILVNGKIFTSTASESTRNFSPGNSLEFALRNALLEKISTSAWTSKARKYSG